MISVSRGWMEMKRLLTNLNLISLPEMKVSFSKTDPYFRCSITYVSDLVGYLHMSETKKKLLTVAHMRLKGDFNE